MACTKGTPRSLRGPTANRRRHRGPQASFCPAPCSTKRGVKKIRATHRHVGSGVNRREQPLIGEGVCRSDAAEEDKPKNMFKHVTKNSSGARKTKPPFFSARCVLTEFPVREKCALLNAAQPGGVNGYQRRAGARVNMQKSRLPLSGQVAYL